MYYPYRRIRTIGRVRAWYASKADRRCWDEEAYPPPPEMRYPGIIPIQGSWADLWPSYIRMDRCSRVRGFMIESRKKVKRLKKRREARRYREARRRTGKG